MALEALASLILMFTALYLMWGAAVVIYDQSRVIEGVQDASQGALVVYDRSTYRGGYPIPGDGQDGGAATKAEQAASSLLYWNSVGLLQDPFGTSATLVPGPVNIGCGPSITGAKPFSYTNCIDGNSTTAAVTEIEVDAQAISFFGFINPYVSPGVNVGREQAYNITTQNGTGGCASGATALCAFALSAGPGAKP